jgi:cytochrome c nitrite reductase small subunit
MISFTFFYAKGWSYLTNDPAACANCHVMTGHYDAWLKGSHRTAAMCNDCHTPHDPIGKYATKADHGFWHSYAFTTGDFHEPIRMKARSREVVEHACRRCHEPIVDMIDARPAGAAHGDAEMSCIRCHESVGHL